MGHIAYMRNEFKSINTFAQSYDNIITLKTIISLWSLNGSYLLKIESPSPKNSFCQVWLNFVQWFLKRRFLNFVNVFLLFRNYLPLKIRGSSLAQTWIPITLGCCSPSFVEIGSVVLEKKMKTWKVFRRREGKKDGWTTDNRWSEKLRWTQKNKETQINKTCIRL